DPGIDRQPGQLPTDSRQPELLVDRAELEQGVVPVPEATAVGGIDERKLFGIAEIERSHLENDGCEVRPQDLGRRERGSPFEVLLGIEAYANTRARAPGPPCSLVGRCLRNLFDREATDLPPRVVSADARRPGVDDVTNSG